MILTIIIQDFPQELFDSVWDAHLAKAKRDGKTLTKTDDFELDFEVMELLQPRDTQEFFSILFGFNSTIEANKLKEKYGK